MAADTSFSFGAFRVDPQNACVWRGTEMLKLTPRAFAVLHYLVSHPGRLVTKDEFFTAIWKETVVGDIALAVCVREIRKGLADDAKTPLYIESVHRHGYRFIAAVTEANGQTDLPVSLSALPVFPPPLSLGPATEVERDREASLPSPGEGQALTAPSRAQPLRPKRGLMLGGMVLTIGAVLLLFYFFRAPLSTPAQPVLPLPDKPSLIVLPLVNLSGDPEQEYFSDGLTEVLTGNFSMLSSLFVIARNSAFTYKGKAVKVQDVSKEMGVLFTAS